MAWSSLFRTSARPKASLGSPWIGWENFEFLFSLPEFGRIFSNTLIISISKIVADQVGAVILALLLNEARLILFRRTIQTLIYLPHFLSWIVLGGILLDILSAAAYSIKLLAPWGSSLSCGWAAMTGSAVL